MLHASRSRERAGLALAAPAPIHFLPDAIWLAATRVVAHEFNKCIDRGAD